MAIKIAGTTVINDTRALQNIASVDATSISSIENAITISSTELASATSLIIYDSTGAAVKTIYGAGS